MKIMFEVGLLKKAVTKLWFLKQFIQSFVLYMVTAVLKISNVESVQS